MPIKKSHLEQKWHYRVAKVLVLLFPIWVVGSALVAKKIPTDHLSNTTYIWAGGFVAYYLCVKVMWRIFLYIAFGGLEDDTIKKEEPKPVQVVVQPAKTSPQPATGSGSGCGALLVIMIIIFGIIMAFAISQSSTGSSSSGGGGSGSGCTPTGCGNLWSCSGTYYSGGVQYRASGQCYPSGGRPGDLYSGWSGTCRQCP